MKIITVCFDYPNQQNKFRRMADVFEVSCKLNSTIPLETYYIDAPKVSVRRSFHSNTDKLDLWNEIVQNANEDIILMDCDMLLRDCIADGFELVTDIGYTYADYDRDLPFNSGVVFVKNTARGKSVMQEWTEVNRQMIHDEQFHAGYKSKYAGINQASWGYLLESGLDASRLPMSIYNLCDNWPNRLAKAVHYKSRLRKAILRINHYNSYRYWVSEWDKYARLISK